MEVLDVGCNTRNRGDINIDILLFHHPDFVRCDTHYLPFKDNSFNTVTALEVLEHLRSPIDALKEWARVARGTIIMSTPNIANIFRLLRFARNKTCSIHEDHIGIFSVAELENLIKKACGWKITKRSYHTGHDDSSRGLKDIMTRWLPDHLRHRSMLIHISRTEK